MSSEIVLGFDRAPSALRYMLRALIPVARPNELVPPLAACWSGHRPDPRAIATFLDVVELPDGPSLPLLYPYVFGFRLSMAILTHPRFPVPIWRVLQIRSHVLQHCPIARDATLEFHVHPCAGRVLARATEIDLRTEVCVGGNLAWESLVTFHVRGRGGGADASSPLAASPCSEARCVASFAMRDDAHWAFGGFTGDYNGIHAWDWYARRFGFARALYHPPRVLGLALARLPPLDAATPQRLDVWMKGPVPHGAAVRLHARSGAEGTTFALHVDPERPAIVGRLREVAPGARLVGELGAPLPA